MIDDEQVLAVLGAARCATSRYLGNSRHQQDAGGDLAPDHTAEMMLGAWVQHMRLVTAALDAEATMVDPPVAPPPALDSPDAEVRWLCTSVYNRAKDLARRRIRRGRVERASLTCERTGEQLDLPDPNDIMRQRDMAQTVALLRRKMPDEEFRLLEQVAEARRLIDVYDPASGSRRRFYNVLSRARARAKRIVEGEQRCYKSLEPATGSPDYGPQHDAHDV